MRLIRDHLVASICCLTALIAIAGPKYTDPKNTDADFAYQGEYVGTIQTDDGERKFGVQIIAHGKGKFVAVGYHGGLPGDGWNGEEPVRSKPADSSLDGGTLKIKHDDGFAVIKKDVLTVYASEDNKVGTMKKVHRKSPTLGKKPPAGAVVLFDGTDAEQWKNGKVVDGGLLKEGTTSIPKFQSHTLHIEFRIPYQPEDRGQGRGNSGLYVQGRYEVQMLDSFGLKGKNNECGGIYSIKDPDVNMCFPPLSWQTYDVEFTAAKFDDDGKMIAKPKMTVKHNGVVVHKDVVLPKSTTASPLRPGKDPGPVFLQNHGCPVRYRNIWVVAK